MRVARILKRSTKRFRSGRVRGGTGNWQIALLLVFGLVGTVGLVASVCKMTEFKPKDKRTLLGLTLYLAVLTIFMCIPAIVLLALNPTITVGIISIVTLCFLALPLLIWIPVAVKRFRDVDKAPQDDAIRERGGIYSSDAECKELQG